MPLPALAQRLLVNQSVAADAMQPTYANFDGLSGVQASILTPGIASVSCEKLGLLETTHHVQWGAGVLTGEVTIEVASDPSYTGAWAPVAVMNFTMQAVSAPREDYTRVQGAYAAYRHRITQPVTGGTVTSKIVGST